MKKRADFLFGANKLVKLQLQYFSSEAYGAEESKSYYEDEQAERIVEPALVIFDELLAQKKAASVPGMAFKGAGIFFGAGCACAAAALIVPPAAPVLALMAACSFALSMFFMLCALGAVAYDAYCNKDEANNIRGLGY